MSGGIFVLTSPRETEDRWQYVRHVTEHISYEHLSPGPRHIVVDGSDADVAELEQICGSLWQVTRYERPSATWLGGNKWPYWKLLRVARDATPADGEALVLEDDLTFCKNAVRRMLMLEVPFDVDWLQFFSAWLFPTPHTHPGLWRSPATLQGCQALKFPRRTLERLCAWAEKDPEWQKYNESDVALGLATERLDLRCANHMPDLVQHAGHYSAVSAGMMVEAGISDELERAAATDSLRGRVSVNFSPQFDAMKLFAHHHLFR